MKKGGERKRMFKEVLVDRDDEIEKLESYLDRTIEGNGNAVIVKGRVGLGKTYLIEKFFDVAEKKGVKIFEGNCITREGAPFHPFLQALENYLSERDKEDLNLPMGIGLLSQEESGKFEGLFDSDDRSTFKKSEKFIKKITKDTPTIIVLEDLHWADKDSLLLLRYLSDKIKNSKIMILGTYRPEEIVDYEIFKETMRYMSHRRLIHYIELDTFNMDETIDMIKSVIDKEPPYNFSDLIFNKTGGNPLFVSETVKSMVNKGVINPEEDVYPGRNHQIEWPLIVQYAIERRIVKLDKYAQHLLQYASILGNEFSYHVLSSFADMDEMDILDHIDSLVDKGIIVEGPGEETYVFENEVLHDTIYENQFKEKRRLLHKRAADSIEEVYEDNIVKYYDKLAYHYQRAQMYDKAYQYYKKSIDFAKENGEINTLINNYRNLRELTKNYKPSDFDKASFLKENGEVLYEHGLSLKEKDQRAAISYLKDAEKLFDEISQEEWAEKCHQELDEID